ncbi:hypothetical protein J7T55_009604 [Diaporthe amygdali]|uniref:uncharacterized protein n=1 Tax=Phomopsis amygdali TaxID=1214568 RepID=UPI0022FDC422|nr:uncharacterized protein J7T55_009604 [Diaporthe amygdali]KAJ0109273.1 hypothetical protein J7T55_009604 [Diaporthe amygdali]
MPPQSQTNQQYAGAQQQRNNYHGVAGGVTGPVAYRGASAPIQPYSFTATPSLSPNGQWQHYSAYRASSSPSIPTMQSFDPANGTARSRHGANASMPNLPNSALNIASVGSRDDSVLSVPGTRRVSPGPRPQSAFLPNSTNQLPSVSTTPAKSQPDRYRRNAAQRAPESGASQGSATPSGSGMAAVSHLYSQPSPNKERRPSPSSLTRPSSFYAKVPGSVDDMQLGRHQEDSRRFRRRSMPALDTTDLPMPKSLQPTDLKRSEDTSADRSAAKGGNDKDQIKTARLVTISSPVAGAKNGSSDSLVSSRSSNSRPSSSAHRNNVPTPTGNPAQLSEPTDQTSTNPDSPRLVNIPPRSSSSDAAKRLANPSPLSKPVTMDTEKGSKGSKEPAAATARPESKTGSAEPSSSTGYDSPAVKQLAAINQKGGKLKSKTSRLRRALSFGSAAELRRAGAADGSKENGGSSEATTSQQNQPAGELDAEQARIAELQEAAGIGNNIYAGSRLFSGSTDNLSISSTASSASIMIRKMGRGMKKGGRSLAGLFRPKSIVGVPTAEVPEASQAAVSMVTVEAERERVNVNPDPNPNNGGGTGFPRLERNSMDVSNAADGLTPERAGSSGTDNSNSRKSIVGGDRERAEVLAAVRKGILKHSNGSSSPSPRVERGPLFDLPAVPHVADSPNSSAPSTPNDEANHNRSGSVTIGSEDYFMTALRLRHETRSAPGTPQGGQSKRNATFSPRIVFHDTWPSQEYDRRSEIATCNRLTPMLAQQIKEELNNFKMEMEVHESSKIYTHFF